MRSATKRCVFGLNIRSSSASRYHDGIVLHAGVCIASPRHFIAIGRCAAVLIALCSAVALWPTAFFIPSSDIHKRP